MQILKDYFFIALLILLATCRSSEVNQERLQLADKIEHSAQAELLNKWYPHSIDTVYGGFLSTFTFDFKPTGDQNKMIVSQARHVWTTAKAALAYPETDHYAKASDHGVE